MKIIACIIVQFYEIPFRSATSCLTCHVKTLYTEREHCTNLQNTVVLQEQDYGRLVFGIFIPVNEGRIDAYPSMTRCEGLALQQLA